MLFVGRRGPSDLTTNRSKTWFQKYCSKSKRENGQFFSTSNEIKSDEQIIISYSTPNPNEGIMKQALVEQYFF